jgi:hypothetical protein
MRHIKLLQPYDIRCVLLRAGNKVTTVPGLEYLEGV